MQRKLSVIACAVTFIASSTTVYADVVTRDCSSCNMEQKIKDRIKRSQDEAKAKAPYRLHYDPEQQKKIGEEGRKFNERRQREIEELDRKHPARYGPPEGWVEKLAKKREQERADFDRKAEQARQEVQRQNNQLYNRKRGWWEKN